MRLFFAVLLAGAGIATGTLIYTQTVEHNNCSGLLFSGPRCSATTRPGWAVPAAMLAATIGIATSVAIASSGRRAHAKPWDSDRSLEQADRRNVAP